MRKINIKSKIRQALFKRHIWIEKIDSKAKLQKFLAQFRKNYVACDLIRIGGNGDGGYLLPNILDNISYCFSPGVGNTVNFEQQLSKKFNIKSFMADASVKQPPSFDNNFEFIPKYLGSCKNEKFITLFDWLNQSKISDNKNIILQMDIEGGEYDVLVHEDSTTLASFSAMVIEFHNLQKLFERDFLNMVSAVFEKLYKNFSICHAHPNNIGGMASLDNIDIPRIVEISFIRNDLIDKCLNKKPITLPHYLDSKNDPKLENVLMPEIWYKNEHF